LFPRCFPNDGLTEERSYAANVRHVLISARAVIVPFAVAYLLARG
jgi:hypothetical protein